MSPIRNSSINMRCGLMCDGKYQLKGAFFLALAFSFMVSSAQAKYSGGTGEPGNPYWISTAEDMNAIGQEPNDWDKHFRLTADISLGGYTGTDFNIIGDDITPFSGVFDGSGHTISNFTYSTTARNLIGLFGYVDDPDAEIKGLRLVNPDIEVVEGNSVGSLVGWLSDGSISGCYVENASVVADDGVGGLVGDNDGTITNCHSAGSVSGHRDTGGLVGYNGFGTISNCYFSGDVWGTGNYLGGLVGWNFGDISSSYSRGSVEGAGDWVGGLTGYNVNTVTNCYSTSSVVGSAEVGGLVGRVFYGTVSNCYSVGSVSGTSDVGGLVGMNLYGSGTVTDSFWDVNSSEQPSGSSPWGTGLTTAEMQTRSTFTNAGWDFVGESLNGTDDMWDICEGTNYPKLAWQIPKRGDFVCPDGVDMDDLDVFVEEWLLPVLSADVAPYGGDGVVNFLDWAIFADGWQITNDIDDLAVFTDQWLGQALSADVAPDNGDDFVDFSDWAVFAAAWQSTPALANWNRKCDIAPESGDDIVDMDDIFIFMEEWLRAGSYYRHLDANIAPDGGDGIVNMLDFAALADNWLTGP